MNHGELRELVRRNLLDAVILLSIPGTLGLLYYIAPLPVQEQLTLNHTNPRWYAFWTNAFVHEHQPGDKHLLMNVVAYLLLIVPTLAIYKLRGQARRFWIAFVVIIAITPLVSSLSSYIAFHEILGLQILNDRGFSGVVGAFDGFLIVTILSVFASEQPEPVGMHSMGLYFAYLTMGLGAVTSRLLFFVIGVLGLLITLLATKTEYVSTWPELSDWGFNHPQPSLVLIAAIFVSALAFAAALPADITSGGSLKNIVAHGAGIVFGMFTAGWQSYSSSQPDSGSWSLS